MTANICPKCGNAVTPIHWRTFIQNDEPTLEPMARLKRSLGEQHHRLALESVDQTWTLGDIAKL